MSDPEPSSDDRNLAVVAHLLGIFFSFLGALVIWLIKKDSSPYVSDHAREALNFQITVFIAQAVAGILTAVGIGCILLPAIMVANLVLCIIAAIAAAGGQWYRYPVTLRLVS